MTDDRRAAGHASPAAPRPGVAGEVQARSQTAGPSAFHGP